MPAQPSTTFEPTATVHHGPLTYNSNTTSTHPAIAAYAKLKADFRSDPQTVMKHLDAYYHPDWTFTSPSGQTTESPQAFFAEFIGSDHQEL